MIDTHAQGAASSRSGRAPRWARLVGLASWLATVAGIAGSVGIAGTAGCVADGETGSGNESYEIDCRGLPCDWVTLEGSVRYGSTWHDGDVGVDLSGEGRAVAEQRVVLLAYRTRQLDLTASMVRDPGAPTHFEFDFYAAGQGPGETFWDRSPPFLVTRSIDVFEQGVFVLHREVLIPSEAAAVVVRVVKEGSGRVMLDEFTLGHA